LSDFLEFSDCALGFVEHEVKQQLQAVLSFDRLLFKNLSNVSQELYTKAFLLLGLLNGAHCLFEVRVALLELRL
jgi:hypothetical protein